MDIVTKFWIFAAVNIVALVYTIVKTRASDFPRETKSLLYVMAVATPLIALVLFFIKQRKHNG